MKKILMFCCIFFLTLSMSTGIPTTSINESSQFGAAMVNIYLSQPNGFGIPHISYVHLYYGSQLKTYTNQFLWPVGPSTNYPGVAFDAYNCQIEAIGNAINIPVYGLQLGQQFYYAYDMVYDDGSESLFYFESQCGFIVTNSVNLLLPPIDLRVVE